MSYFDPNRSQANEPSPYAPPAAPAYAYPVDEDGDRLYTEEDYAVAPDGDAFLPDEQEQPSFDPFAAPPVPMSYAGSYDSLDDQEEEAYQSDHTADYDDEEYLTDAERMELRRSSWKLMAGLADFAGVIVGTAAILILIALLVSLINWLVADVSQTFTLLQMPR